MESMQKTEEVPKTEMELEANTTTNVASDAMENVNMPALVELDAMTNNLFTSKKFEQKKISSTTTNEGEQIEKMDVEKNEENVGEERVNLEKKETTEVPTKKPAINPSEITFDF
jgi:hypothetical protein